MCVCVYVWPHFQLFLKKNLMDLSISYCPVQDKTRTSEYSILYKGDLIILIIKNRNNNFLNNRNKTQRVLSRVTLLPLGKQKTGGTQPAGTK